MAAKLIAEEGILKGLVLSLEDGEQWVIGRDPDACQLLVEDPSASRKHLVCRSTPQGIVVENLSTTNPVQVNGEEVKEPRLLNNGDAVKIGSGIFRYNAAQNQQEPPKEAPEQEKEEEKEEVSETPADKVGEKIEKTPLQTEEPVAQEAEAAVSEPLQTESRAPQAENTSSQHSVDETADAAINRNAEFTESIFNEGESEEELNSDIEPLEPIKPNQTSESVPANQSPPAASPPVDDKEAKDAQPLENENIALPNSAVDQQVLPENSIAPPESAPVPDIAGEEEEPKRHDSIYEDEPSDKHELAEINFGFLDTGRWLLKVIGGPNNGAEFSMQTGSTYVIGTDPHSCDIVFHDTSVSRQHARIGIEDDDTLTVEDLKSRNGTLVDGEPLHGKRSLTTNTLVSMGTTSFIVFDREGEMQTIISPLLPSIVKVLQKEEPKKTDEEVAAEEVAAKAAATAKKEASKALEHHAASTLPAIILIGILASILAVVGIGTSTLFRSEPVTIGQSVDETKALDEALAAFPSVKYTFSKSTGRLLLVGHVLTASDKNQLIYALQGYSFIKNLDDSGIIIDEYVWREINQVLSKNPVWKGITVSSPSAGHFVISGYLQTRSQAEQLAEYMNSNFTYLDLLEQKVVVDEEVIGSAKNILQGFNNVKVTFANGEISLTGGIPPGKTKEFEELVTEVRGIHGVRNVNNYITELAPDQSMVNISDKYDVTGFSNQGGTNLNVVINGRILRKGDMLDGMLITNIQTNAIFLEKENVKYKIDFSK